MQIREASEHTGGVGVELDFSHRIGRRLEAAESFEHLLVKSDVAGEVGGGLYTQLLQGVIHSGLLPGEILDDRSHHDPEDQK